MKLIDRFAPYVDLIPIALVVALTFYFTVDVPASDDWDFVPIVQKMREGTLDWKTLDTPYTGHKTVVPYLVVGGIAVATNWNTYAIRFINLLIFAGAWLAIRPAAVRAGHLLAASVFFWSWDQWAAFLWTTPMCCTIAVFCILWSLRLLESRRWLTFVPAMVLAMVATFSHGTGLAVWPAACYLMFFTPRPLPQRVVFGIVMALAFYLFFQGNHATGTHTPKDLMRGKNYLQMPIFLLQTMGGPAGGARMGIAAVVALGGLLMLGVSRAWEKFRAEPLTAALMLAGLGMMGLVMIARGGGIPLIEATDSRYGTMAALYWVGVVLMVDWTSWRRYALVVLTALCILRSVTRIPVLMRYKKLQEAEARGLLKWTPDRFVLKGAQTTPSQLDADERLLRDWHYSLFRNR